MENLHLLVTPGAIAYDGTRSLRADTPQEKRLLLRLCRQGFVQVRGPPASGKTTMSLLLSRYVKEREPNTRTILIDGWPSNRRWQSEFATVGWKHDDGSVLIIDEAQLTYEMTGLWNSIFKPISANPSRYQNRIIIFASYGSPSGTAVSGTLMEIPDCQRVTLRQIDHSDNIRPIELLLRRDEFDNFMSLRYPPSQYHFDLTFLQLLYDLSIGHVGAIEDLIRVVTTSDSYIKLKRSCEKFSEDDFHCLDEVELLQSLSKSGVFRRGLPPDNELRNVNISRVLDSVSILNVTTMDAWQGADDSEALMACFRKGWLHADLLSPGYVFSSPLHRWFVERKLRVTNYSVPSHNSLFDFTLDVLQRCDPRNLWNARQIGPGGIQAPPEAQFQNEFYRCCHAISHCAIVTFPEYGTKRGWVDFYIPSRKWGIELLREDGHYCRFAAQDNIDDFIVLDCRQREVRKRHPSLPNLFHLVFSDDLLEIKILNSTLDTVTHFRLLNSC